MNSASLLDKQVTIAGLPGDPAFRLATEVNEVCELLALRNFKCYLIQSRHHCQPRLENNFISLVKRPDDLCWHTISLHADFIDPAGHAWMTIHDHERWHVLNHLRAAANDGHFTDSTKLVHRRQPADDGVILDRHMPGQCAVVAEDHMVADNAVVRNVRVRQKIPVRPDPCRQSIAGRRVHRRVFPEHIRRADFEKALTAVKLQVLRFQPNAGKRIKFIARPDRRPSVEHDV